MIIKLIIKTIIMVRIIIINKTLLSFIIYDYTFMRNIIK